MAKTLLLPLALLLWGCGAPSANEAEQGATVAEAAPPAKLPRDEEVAAACYSSPHEMMSEEARLAGEGVFIEPTFEEFLVRETECGWRSPEGKVAGCRFEQASIPLGFQEPPERERYLARMRERDWRKTEADLSFDIVSGWSCRLRPLVEAQG